MKRWSQATALAAIALAGCSLPLEMTLVNDSGRMLVVLAEGAPSSSTQGASATFVYPRPDQQWQLRLRTPDCELVYVVPSSMAHYPWRWEHGIPLMAQVEPDLRIHLVPQTTVGVTDVSRLAAVQTDGFPLRPISSSCRK